MAGKGVSILDALGFVKDDSVPVHLKQRAWPSLFVFSKPCIALHSKEGNNAIALEFCNMESNKVSQAAA